MNMAKSRLENGSKKSGINMQMKYTGVSDQKLLNFFKQSGDREALAALYERYRAPIGRYLYRQIKNKTTVANAFNTIMLRLTTEPAIKSQEHDLSTHLFAMAYKLRREYANENQSHSVGPVSLDASGQARNSPVGNLPRKQLNVLELVYQHNFSFNQAAHIMGCSADSVKNSWSEAKNQHLNSVAAV